MSVTIVVGGQYGSEVNGKNRLFEFVDQHFAVSNQSRFADDQVTSGSLIPRSAKPLRTLSTK